MESINYWHWFIAGVVLIVLEVFAPGAFFASRRGESDFKNIQHSQKTIA
jgi:hypothetical protein